MLTTPLCHNTKLFLPRHCCCTTFALIRLYDTRASVQRNKSIPAQVTRCTCATTAPPLCQHTANQEIWHLFQCPQCHRTLECKISIISFWGELIIQNLGYGLVIKEQLCLIIFCATVTLNCDWHTVYPAVACLATQQSSRAYPIHDTRYTIHPLINFISTLMTQFLFNDLNEILLAILGALCQDI